MRGVELCAVRQREDLLMHRRVQRLRAPLLEVGPAAAADEHSVAGEHHAAARLGVVAHAAVGVPRRRADLERDAPDSHNVPRPVVDVRLCAGRLRDAGLDRREPFLYLACSCDVIRVAVRVDGVHELQPEVLNNSEVAVNQLHNGIDDDSLLGDWVGEDVSVGRGAKLGIKKLPENDSDRRRPKPVPEHLGIHARQVQSACYVQWRAPILAEIQCQCCTCPFPSAALNHSRLGQFIYGRNEFVREFLRRFVRTQRNAGPLDPWEQAGDIGRYQDG
mmetsp:Transcript_11419/g.27095  ORF Transcript_11419/g.27095 Transcript_11419/m.27095 type:complete len:275 (-) Transcript_11419:724-1548(-)